MKPTTIEALAAARIGRDAFQRIEKNAGTTAAVRAAIARMLADQHQERAAWGVPPAPVPGTKSMPVIEPTALDDARDRVAYLEARAQDLETEIVTQDRAMDDMRHTIEVQRAELAEVDRKLERTIGGMRKTTEAACMRNRELETAVATLQAKLDDARAEIDDARAERDNARTALERVSEQLARAMAKILGGP